MLSRDLSDSAKCVGGADFADLDWKSQRTLYGHDGLSRRNAAAALRHQESVSNYGGPQARGQCRIMTTSTQN